MLKQILLPGMAVGAAFDGSHLWYTLGFSFDTRLYRHNLVTNAVDLTLDMSVLTGGRNIVPGGLAWDANRGHLWVAAFIDLDNGTGYGLGEVFEVDPLAGAVVSSFPTWDITQADEPLSGVIDGLAYDSESDTLWLSPDQSVNVYQVTTTGVFVSSFLLPLGPGLWNAGIAYDGEDLWFNIRTGGFRGYSPGWVNVTFYGVDSPGEVEAGLSHDLDPIRSEDLAFDPVTFAPSCAIWVASYSVNALTALESPCHEDDDEADDGDDQGDDDCEDDEDGDEFDDDEDADVGDDGCDEADDNGGDDDCDEGGSIDDDDGDEEGPEDNDG